MNPITPLHQRYPFLSVLLSKRPNWPGANFSVTVFIHQCWINSKSHFLWASTQASAKNANSELRTSCRCAADKSAFVLKLGVKTAAFLFCSPEKKTKKLMCAFVKCIYTAVINTLNSHWIFQSSFFNCTVILVSFSFFTYSNSSRQLYNFPRSHSHCVSCWLMLSADLCSHLEEESCHIFSVCLASYTVDADSSKHTDPKTDSSVPLGSLLHQLCHVSIAKLYYLTIWEWAWVHSLYYKMLDDP